MKSLGVFCGARRYMAPVYRDAARELGRLLAERGIRLVYGGGNVGMMGYVAEAALQGGGIVFGVMPKRLVEMEIAHHGITELRIVDTMHERKQIMMNESDAFLALPGGVGTMEEIFEVISWGRIGYHRKRCGFLDIHGFYDDLKRQFDRMVTDEFLSADDRAQVAFLTTPAACIDHLLGS